MDSNDTTPAEEVISPQDVQNEGFVASIEGLTEEVKGLRPEVNRLNKTVEGLKYRQRIGTIAASIAIGTLLLLGVIGAIVYDRDQETRRDRRAQLDAQQVADCEQTNSFINATVNAFNRAGVALYPPAPAEGAPAEEVAIYEAQKAEIDSILEEIRDDPSLSPVECG